MSSTFTHLFCWLYITSRKSLKISSILSLKKGKHLVKINKLTFPKVVFFKDQIGWTLYNTTSLDGFFAIYFKKGLGCCDVTVLFQSAVDGLITFESVSRLNFCDLCFANNWGKYTEPEQVCKSPNKKKKKNCPCLLYVCAISNVPEKIDTSC